MTTGPRATDMQSFPIIATLLVLTAIGYYLGRNRAIATAGGQRRTLHSLPSYHGAYVALWCALPAFILFALWLVLEPHVIRALLISSLPPEAASLPENQLNLLLNDINNLAHGGDVSSAADPVKVAVAQK